MHGRDPEGYKKLLAYQKAADVQKCNLQITDLFPRSFSWLKEQMDKSGRSGTKNIIEGWKRNTTKEYYDFLGFSIGAIEELKDDAADIATGLYKPLMGIKGIMGTRGEPFQPFTPIQLEKLRFYPLDQSLPPVVQLYLKCKEVLMLLDKLQLSLDHKMDSEQTRSFQDKRKRRKEQDRQMRNTLEREIEEMGMVRLLNGQVIDKAEYETRRADGEDLKLFGEE